VWSQDTFTPLSKTLFLPFHQIKFNKIKYSVGIRVFNSFPLEAAVETTLEDRGVEKSSESVKKLRNVNLTGEKHWILWSFYYASAMLCFKNRRFSFCVVQLFFLLEWLQYTCLACLCDIDFSCCQLLKTILSRLYCLSCSLILGYVSIMLMYCLVFIAALEVFVRWEKYFHLQLEPFGRLCSDCCLKRTVQLSKWKMVLF